TRSVIRGVRLRSSDNHSTHPSHLPARRTRTVGKFNEAIVWRHRSALLAPCLLVVLSASGRAQQLQSHGERPMYHAPRWSPDGKWILAVSMTSSGSKLVVLPAAGGSRTTVATGTLRLGAADWTAAGAISFLADSAGV